MNSFEIQKKKRRRNFESKTQVSPLCHVLAFIQYNVILANDTKNIDNLKNIQ